jgi:hypothetical protein
VFVTTTAAATDPAPELPEFFDPETSAWALELVPDDDRADLAASLEDAGRNWTELAAAVSSLEGEEREAAVWLVNGMPHLDRLEMTSRTLVEHVAFAHRSRDEMPYDVPEEMFRPYILTYRIEEEPVEPWRKELFELFAPVAEREGTAGGTARAINTEIADTVEERDREFFGPRQSPILTLRSGRGTGAEISILACAAMKAVGIPSRQTRIRALGAEDGGASWIEVFDGEEWLPLYPLEPDAFGDRGHLEKEHPGNVTAVASLSAFERVLVTESYTETGTVAISFVRGGERAREFEHFAVSVWNEGALVPLDELNAIADEEGRFSALLGEGTYVVQAGVRDERGNPFVMMRETVVAPGETTFVAFDVTLDGRGAGPDPASAAGLGQVLGALVVHDLSGEPSRRMLPLIRGTLDRREANVSATYRVVGDEGNARAGEPPASVTDALTEGGSPVELGDELPVVLLYELATNEVILHQEGYDLNIGRALEIAVDARLSELLER